MQELVLQQHLIGKQVTNKQKIIFIAIISVKTFEMLNYQSFLKKMHNNAQEWMQQLLYS